MQTRCISRKCEDLQRCDGNHLCRPAAMLEPGICETQRQRQGFPKAEESPQEHTTLSQLEVPLCISNTTNSPQVAPFKCDADDLQGRDALYLQTKRRQNERRYSQRYASFPNQLSCLQEDIKEQRARRNRESAKRSRLKSKLHFCHMEITYGRLKRENMALRLRVAKILQEVQTSDLSSMEK